MPSDNLTRDKLKEMAKLTMFSGRISSVHEKNLTNFPFVFFDNLESVKLEYDLTPKKEGSADSKIAYFLIFLSDKEQTQLEKRFKSLEIAVRELFWSDIKLEVYFDNNLVFKSK